MCPSDVAFSGILLMEPYFQPTIWGGRKLADEWGYDIPDGPVGECWAISAHPHGESHVVGGPFDGMSVSELWERHHDELFAGAQGDRFPLLVKIIDAAQDLSVQVHPDDAYAAQHEDGSLGKRECWYVLGADQGARIVCGQNARDAAECRQMIERGAWDELLNEVDVAPGDFFQVDPGTVHALSAGTMVLEVQQSSDITYRLYDHDRLQADGTPRELHIDKALDVIDFAAQAPASGKVTAPEEGGITELVSCESYAVRRVRVSGGLELPTPEPFLCASVISGAGRACGTPVEKGSHFIVPSGCAQLALEGEMELIIGNAI